MKQKFLLLSVIAILLGSCAIGPYVPRIRDVKEERFDGDSWRQWFTLYNPANPGSDCPIDRVGQRIDLNSPLAVADAWRTYCRTTSDNNARSDNN
jgi:hypothetical protein